MGEHDPRQQRADCRRAAQEPEADRAGVEDLLREQREQSHGAAEQNGEQVERDRAEHHRRPPDEPHAAEERRPVRRGAGALDRGLVDHQHGDRPRREEHRRDHVDELGPDCEQQAAERGADDRAALESERPKRDGAREELPGDEGDSERAAGGRGEDVAHACHGGQDEERPQLVGAGHRHPDERQRHEGGETDRRREHEVPRDAVCELSRGEREEQHRHELEQADQAQIEGGMADREDLPADRDRDHVDAEALGRGRRPVQEVVPSLESGGQAVADRRTDRETRPVHRAGLELMERR